MTREVYFLYILCKIIVHRKIIILNICTISCMNYLMSVLSRMPLFLKAAGVTPVCALKIFIK